MPTEKNFEHSPENIVEKDFYVVMKDITDFGSFNLEEISERAVKNILDDMAKEKNLEKHLRQKYNLPPEQLIAEALQQYAKKSLEEYRRAVTEKKQLFHKQAKYCYNLAREKNLVTETKKVDIIITDPILNIGLEHSEYSISRNSFNPDLNAVVIDHQQPNRVLAHEMGHALSYRPKQSRAGFRYIEKTQDGKMKLRRNHWFDEGVTIIWEEMSVNDGSVIPSRDESYDTYGWDRDATRLILREIGVSDELALKAYFGDEEAKQILEGKINNRFNCSLEDLEGLSVSHDIELTRRMITGEKAELTFQKSTHKTIIKEMQKLSEIFPNITIKEVEK